MLELRQDPRRVIERVAAGETLTLTYRGRAVMRMAPIETAGATDDGYRRLLDLVGAAGESAGALSADDPDRAIDRLVYGD